MRSFAYYCFDLDGTLLDSNKRIPAGAIHSIYSLKNDRKHIILASGRHYDEMKVYAHEIGMSEGDFIISCDGQYIFDHQGSLLYSFPLLKKSDAVCIEQFFRGSVIYVSSEGGDYVIIPLGLRYIIRRFKTLINNSHLKVFSNVQGLDESLDIEKIRVIKNNGIMDDVVRNRYSIHDDSVLIDFQYKGVNKYNALEMLKEMGMIENLDSLLYFGNDINDLECFERLEWTVAMGDTLPFLAEKASFITSRNDDNGIAAFFELK